MDEVLAQSGLFQGLSEEAVEPVVSRLETVTLPRGRVVFNEGEPGDSLYIVLTGKIKLSRRAPDGRENVLAVMGPSDQFGELSVFDPGPRTATATAVTDVRLARMPQSMLRPWIEAHPEIGEQLLRVLARRLRRTNDSVADLIFTDVPGRVAKALLQMADRFGSRESDGLRVKHDLTQEELAQLVGASRETVNKALADFVHRGWIQLQGKSVVVLDEERLRRRARVADRTEQPDDARCRPSEDVAEWPGGSRRATAVAVRDGSWRGVTGGHEEWHDQADARAVGQHGLACRRGSARTSG